MQHHTFMTFHYLYLPLYDSNMKNPCANEWPKCNGTGLIASGAGGWVADGIPLWFATLGSFPHCKWDCKWCWCRSCRWSFGGSLARNAFLRDSRCTKPCVFPYKVRPRTSMIYLCGATVARRSRVWSDRSRIMVGSFSDRFRIVNGVSPVFRAFVVDRIPLWFATVGSFPQCKWDCKWCWWMSCRWNSIVICNSRIVPSL